MKYVQSQGEDLYRRSLYTHWKRTLPPPTMAILDASDREICRVSPQRTNTPLQALATLNEKVFVEAARNLGQRILLQGGDSMADQIAFAFRTVAARYPTAKETALLTEAYNEYREAFAGDEEAARQLIAVGESEPDPSLAPIALAAATTLANTLLNLDEVLTKE